MESGPWSALRTWTIRSHELNQENVIGVLDGGFGEQMEAAFRQDLTRAQEVQPERWRRRGRSARLLERAAALLAEQY
jgi:phosphatidylserine/phosphatidylglycerophosphate/cardiolipin synthase-like enzyme